MSDVELGEPEIEESEPEFMTGGALAQINASEINQMVATAKRFPRNLAKVRKQAYHLIVSDEETAASCTYAVPRDGKVITGPSARFAEIVAHSWGNNRHGSRIVDEGEQTVRAQGFFFDVESNVAVTCEVTVRIVDREGRRYSPDMIVNSSNAAASRADRNAVLKGIPRASWQWLLDQAQATVKGNVKTLAERRDKALALLKPFGLTPGMICQVLGVEGVSEIGTDQLTSLQAILNGLKESELTVEGLMQNTQARAVAAKGERTVDQIKMKYRKPAGRDLTPEEIAKAQSKLEEKRKAAQAGEPAKVSEVMEATKAEEQF